MKRTLVCTAVLLGLAAPALADTWSLGYGTVPLTYNYVINDFTAGVRDTQGEEKYSMGVLNVLYEHDRKVSDSIHLVLTAGVGFPIGTASHDPTKDCPNPTATTSKNASNYGDTIEWSALTIPVLVGAKYSMPMGDNALAFGVSVGGVVVGVQNKRVDQNWTGAVPNQTLDYTDTNYPTIAAPTYAILANIGYHIKQGAGSAISITATVGVLGEARMDMETVRTTPAATQMNTDKSGGRIGGMTFGVNLGWSKAF